VEKDRVGKNIVQDLTPKIFPEILEMRILEEKTRGKNKYYCKL